MKRVSENDYFMQLMVDKLNQLKLNQIQKRLIIERYRSKRQNLVRKYQGYKDLRNYIPIKIIGRGAFGEVRLCLAFNEELVVVKKLKKSEMLQKN